MHALLRATLCKTYKELPGSPAWDVHYLKEPKSASHKDFCEVISKIESLGNGGDAGNMSGFDFLANADFIGFDMDFTLLEYKTAECRKKLFESARRYLSEQTMTNTPDVSMEEQRATYELFQNFDIEHWDGVACKGMYIDVDMGNIIKMDAAGRVCSAFHGQDPLSHSEMEQSGYAVRVFQVRESDEVDTSGLTRSVTSPNRKLMSYGATKPKRFRRVYTPNDCTFATMFMMLVESSDGMQDDFTETDAEKGVDPDSKKTNRYHLFHRSLMSAFNFIQTTRCSYGYANGLMLDRKQYVYKQAPQRRLLAKFKQRTGKKLFMVTNADHEHASGMMSFIYGSDWRSVFDMVVVRAKKSVFFGADNEAKFRRLNAATGAFAEVASGGLKLGTSEIYCGGNAHDINRVFNAAMPSKESARILYFGDSLLDDVVNPRMAGWQTVAIVPEMRSMGKAVAFYDSQEKQQTPVRAQKSGSTVLVPKKSAKRFREISSSLSLGSAGGGGSKGTSKKNAFGTIMSFGRNVDDDGNLDAKLMNHPMTDEDGSPSSMGWSIMQNAELCVPSVSSFFELSAARKDGVDLDAACTSELFQVPSAARAIVGRLGAN